MTIRLAAISALYAAAIAFIAFGVANGPAHGWPVNDSQVNGCAALVLGMIAKVAGHCVFAGIGRIRP